MKKIAIFLSAFIMLFSCTKLEPELTNDQTNPAEAIASDVPMTPQEINAKIKDFVAKKGEFSWNDADDNMLWSALTYSNNILTIGYGETPFSNIKSAADQQVKEHLLKIAGNEENVSKLKKGEKLLIYEDPVINYIDIYVKDINTLKTLRNEKGVRYVEAIGYEFYSYEDDKSDSGCDKTASTVNPADYTTVAPNCLVSWTFYKHNIPSAWSYSTGAGIYVGLIDTGVSPDQVFLGANFNHGYSTGRLIYKYGVFVNSIWPWSTTTDGSDDKCGHGTLMAATIAGPRNSAYMPTGVAYNCNLIAYRATGDVVLDGYHEQSGVARAITELADRSYLKIMSMSIGHIISIGKISDAIKYAYNKGKLMICAGGTSTNFTNWAGVIFPANMAETVAVTGIKDGSGYTVCDVCHKGDKIDFTVIMERSSDPSRHSVCLAFYKDQKSYVGGSSVATATTAGIAALIWAKNPSWTRSQVLEKMKQSASLYPNKHSEFGYGNIDALKAVL